MQLLLVRSLQDLQENYFNSFFVCLQLHLWCQCFQFSKILGQSEVSDNIGFWPFERQVATYFWLLYLIGIRRTNYEEYEEPEKKSFVDFYCSTEQTHTDAQSWMKVLRIQSYSVVGDNNTQMDVLPVLSRKQEHLITYTSVCT